MLPTLFQLYTSQQKNVRYIIKGSKPFLSFIFFFQYTNIVRFEKRSIFYSFLTSNTRTFRLIFDYIRYRTLDINPAQTPFQIGFNSVSEINSGTIYRTNHPHSLPPVPIQVVFVTYMDKLIEYNEKLNPFPYQLSHPDNL